MAFFLLRPAVLLAALVSAAPSPQSLKSGLTILINNDLQGSSSPASTSGLILLGRRSYEDAVSGCQALGEQLWAPELQTASIQPNLDYLVYQKKAQASSLFWIASQASKNDSRAIDASGRVSVTDARLELAALCTQSAPYSNATAADTGAKWQVSVSSNNETLTGFRDRLSFRFLGVRFAPQPRRFSHSIPHTGSGGPVAATEFGSQCVQGSNTGSEDCLFLNIFTPYLTGPGGEAGKEGLKPVMFWIHGGAFTGGTGSDPTVDGGSLASRGDVVVVTINYRLTTLGFLALNDGVTNGNFGLADQINALDWVRAHIANFGGDPDRITIFGQSAGAGSVRAMMASPKAIGKFAGAIPLSNLGGINYGATYSKYYTIAEEVSVAAAAILSATNCTHAASQVDCLRAVPAAALASLGTVARFLVVDGTYLTSAELSLTGPRLPVELMMGIMRDDGAPFITYPQTTNETAYLSGAGFPVPPASLFPAPDGGSNQTLNLYNVSSRLATDGIFRCVDQATVYAGVKSGRLGPVYYYEFDRSYQTSGWPGTDVCNPPKTADRPHGDPNKPYFKCHSGELYYVFGNLARQGLPMRDEHDLPFAQFVLDSFASFARTYNPNPDPGFLEARAFTSTLNQVQTITRWAPVTKEDGAEGGMRVLAWPLSQESFRERPQCDALKLGVANYYGQQAAVVPWY